MSMQVRYRSDEGDGPQIDIGVARCRELCLAVILGGGYNTCANVRVFLSCSSQGSRHTGRCTASDGTASSAGKPWTAQGHRQITYRHVRTCTSAVMRQDMACVPDARDPNHCNTRVQHPRATPTHTQPTYTVMAYNRSTYTP